MTTKIEINCYRVKSFNMNLNFKYNEKLSPLEKELIKIPKIFTGVNPTSKKSIIYLISGEVENDESECQYVLKIGSHESYSFKSKTRTIYDRFCEIENEYKMDDLKIHALFLISNNYALKPIENLIKDKLNDFKISMTINCRNKADVYKYDHDVYFNVTIFFNYFFKKGILQTCYNKSLDDNKISKEKVIYYLSTDDESESSEGSGSDSIDESIDSRGNLKDFIGIHSNDILTVDEDSNNSSSEYSRESFSDNDSINLMDIDEGDIFCSNMKN